MPHWTLPKPGDNDPTASTLKALSALQETLDGVFDRPADLTASELDTLASHVATFNADFDKHLTAARAKLASS